MLLEANPTGPTSNLLEFQNKKKHISCLLIGCVGVSPQQGNKVYNLIEPVSKKEVQNRGWWCHGPHVVRKATLTIRHFDLYAPPIFQFHVSEVTAM